MQFMFMTRRTNLGLARLFCKREFHHIVLSSESLRELTLATTAVPSEKVKDDKISGVSNERIAFKFYMQ